MASATPVAYVILTLVVGLSGCTGMSQTEQSALSGGAMGAAGGALIGAMAGNAGMGAAIGGEVGLTGGYLYGKHKESEQKAYQQGSSRASRVANPEGRRFVARTAGTCREGRWAVTEPGAWRRWQSSIAPTRCRCYPNISVDHAAECQRRRWGSRSNGTKNGKVPNQCGWSRLSLQVPRADEVVECGPVHPGDLGHRGLRDVEGPQPADVGFFAIQF